jgi:peptidase S24-like protein
MSAHLSDESIERFSMGRLEGLELLDFENHLLQCDDCLHAVRSMDLFLDAMRTLAHPAWRSGRRSPKFKGEYQIIQAVLPGMDPRNIGILLRTQTDRLCSRFRRDFEEFAGDQSTWLKELAQTIPGKADGLGADKCLEWLKSTYPRTIRISRPRKVAVAGYGARTLDALYDKHVRPEILPFRTHLPQYSLEAAAGKFGRQMSIEPEGWIEVHTDMTLTGDMFVIHVEGRSMEPQIPDGSLCAFRAHVGGSWNGKVLLIEQYGESGGSRYTVKRCRLSENADLNKEGDRDWLHERMTLESINPDYESWDVASAGKIRALGEFLFVVGSSGKAER